MMHVHLLDNDPALALYLFGGQGRIQKNIGDHVKSAFKILVADFGEVAGVLALGEGVINRAQAVEFRGNFYF